MAQPPFQIDQLQIEPSATGTRLINRDSTDDSLRFSDPFVVATLLQLVGLRNVMGLYLVGQGGDGAPYTAIQDAIDAIPDTSSPSAPSLIAVLSGEYQENLVIDKNGVYLVGLGGVRITNALADATIKIADAPTTTPEAVVLQNLTIVNTDPSEECVLIQGAGTYSSGTITVVTSPLAAGDTFTIGGITFTGVVGPRNSGSDNFSVSGGTTDTIAADIEEAINDPANSLAVTVTATRVSSVVTITANVPGPVGDTITLAVVTTPAGGMTVSGVTLTGGSTSGSMVAYDEVTLLDCNLVASGVGTYPVRADTVNNVRVQGGTWRGSSSTANARVTNCAAFRLFDVEWVNDLELGYDTLLPVPAILTTEYTVKGCGRVQDVLCNLVGLGSLFISDCSEVGDVTQGGDQTLTLTHSHIGALAVSDTTVASLSNTPRGAASVPGGTPTLAESFRSGTVTFAGTLFEVVTFDVPQPDTNYAVYLDCPVLGIVPQVTAKTTTDFTVSTSVALVGTVSYTVTRQM